MTKKTDDFTAVPHPISPLKVEKQWATSLECSPREQTSERNTAGLESSFWKTKFLTAVWRLWKLKHNAYGFKRWAYYLWGFVSQDELFIWLFQTYSAFSKTQACLIGNLIIDPNKNRLPVYLSWGVGGVLLTSRQPHYFWRVQVVTGLNV